MQSKTQKRNEARKNAEALKAKKKAARAAKTGSMSNAKPGKGKSLVPQSKKKQQWAIKEDLKNGEKTSDSKNLKNDRSKERRSKTKRIRDFGRRSMISPNNRMGVSPELCSQRRVGKPKEEPALYKS